MAVDLQPEVQLAIRLLAAKHSTTTGTVVAEAIERAFPQDIEDAKKALQERANAAQQRI